MPSTIRIRSDSARGAGPAKPAEKQLIILALSYLGSGEAQYKGLITAGGDTRLLDLLRRRPSRAPEPLLAISREGAETFQANLTSEQRSLCVDELFKGPSRGMLFSAVVQSVRTVAFVSVSLLTPRVRGEHVIYSSSNLLPDVLAAVMMKLLKPRNRWIAVVHHIPFGSENSTEPRARRLLSTTFANLSAWLIANLADAAVAYHQPTIDRLSALGLPPERLFQNGNGVDLEEIELAVAAAGTRKGKSAICVGRFSHQKGTDILLQIWKRVCLVEPDATLTLVGAEESFTVRDIEAMAERLGISKSVIVRGRLPRRDLLCSLASSTAALFPSFVEGWGIALLESIACGTPVVAWDLPAYRPMVDAIATVPLRDERAFADRTIEILRDAEIRDLLVNRARKASGNFSVESVCQREWDFIARMSEDGVVGT